MLRKIALTVIALFWCSFAFGQNVIGSGVYGDVKVASGAAYIGVGDKFPGATGAYGLRGYNALYATGSNSAAIVCDTATFTTCSTINILASGDFDTATASSSAACATACVVKSLTDQSGHGNTMTCASASACAALIFNCNGTKPCLRFNNAPEYTTVASMTLPLSMSAVVKRTGNFAAYQAVISESSNPIFGFNGANTAIYNPNGGSVTAAATDSVMHAMQATNTSSTSVLYVDDITPVSGSVGGITGSGISLGNRGGGIPLTGDMEEAYIWSGITQMAGSDATNVCHNERIYWGTAGAC